MIGMNWKEKTIMNQTAKALISDSYDMDEMARNLSTIVGAVRLSPVLISAVKEHCQKDVEDLGGLLKQVDAKINDIADELGI